MGDFDDIDDIFDEDENQYKILISELKRSNDFFQLLSITLKDTHFQEQAKFAIENINDMEEYLLNDCNGHQIQELIDRMNGF